MRKFAIFGAGITGLLAAKAINDSGGSFKIFDKSAPSQDSAGLHYLHRNCGLPLEKATICNVLVGAKSGVDPAEIYGRKIFGAEVQPSNSLMRLPAYNTIYDIRAAKDMLLEQYGGCVELTNINRDVAKVVCAEFDYVISTIPAFCLFDGHFPRQGIYVSKSIPTGTGIPELFENFSMYNVGERDHWCRASRVFGQEYTESATSGEQMIYKVIDGIFENPFDNMMLVGRYGAWKRNYLAHMAYYDVKRVFFSNK